MPRPAALRRASKRPVAVLVSATAALAACVGASAVPTPAVADPADGRHAELISGNIAPGRSAATMYPDVSVDGNSVVFSAVVTQPSSVNGSGLAPYVARRSATGWNSVSASLPGSAGGPATGSQFSTPVLLPPGAERIVVQTYGQQDPSNPVTDPANLRNFVMVPGASTGAALVGRPFQNSLASALIGQQTLSSVFLTLRPATAGEPGPTPVSRDGVPIDFYQFVRQDAQGLTIASRLPDGSLFDAASQGTTAGEVQLYGFGDPFPPDGTNPQAGSGTNAISTDGRRLYFNAYDAAGKQQPARDEFGSPLQPLYVSDGDQTVAVSTSKLDGGVKAARFIGASRDGDISYFVTDESLDGDADDGGAVYRYQLSATGEKLTRLTPRRTGLSLATLRVRSAKASRDGSKVYFATSADLGGGAQEGSQNAYVWANGDLRFVADLGSDIDGGASGTVASVSRDGRFAVLRSSAAVAGANTGGFRQLFRYDYEAAAGDRVRCASCRPDGSANEGSSGFRPEDLFGEPQIPQRSNPRGISDNGHVFFTAADRLVPEDSTLARDAYEYTGSGLRMLSDGRGNSYTTDNTDDGRGVYLVTAQPQAPEDNDGGQLDLYVRREGSDIQRGESPTPCVGDACQSASPGAVPAPSATSQRAGANENATRPPRVTAALLAGPSLSADAVRALARGHRANVRVRLRGTGRLSVRGTARVGSRRRLVASGVVRARQSETRTATISLRLNGLGLRELRRNGRLAIRMEVRFGSGRARATTVTLRTAAR